MRPDVEELRRLYEDEGLSTRDIGARCGVSKTSVRRWLGAAGIEPRAKGSGLENRGIDPPSAADLFRMVHVDLQTYPEIARQYGVDQSAVWHWLKAHGIPTSGRRKLPDVPEEDLREMYDSGESIESIASTVGCCWNSIAKLFKRYGIETRPDGWQRGIRYGCNDGHEVRSVYERRVDDWLSSHGVEHEVEPLLPFGTGMRSDFLAAGAYIEVWGVTNNAAYTERRRIKEEQYLEHNLPLVSLPLSAFDRRWNRWEAMLGDQFL